MKLSAVVLTKNQNIHLTRCLSGLGFCDEILIIDDYSNDLNTGITEDHKITIFKRHLNNDFSAQRNFGLQKALYDWVLFVDSDEVITRSLAEEIVRVINNPKVSGFYIGRSDFLWGKNIKFGEAGSIKLLRLGRKDCGEWRRKVHEYWDIVGQKRTLKNKISHYPHKSVYEFVKKLNRYSTLHSHEIHSEGKVSSLFKILVYPLAKFFHNYILRLGFLDGEHGFIYAILMSFHSFSAWVKLWLYQKGK